MKKLDKIISDNESKVRSYSRSFPVVFEKAKMATLYDVNGNAYIDFFAGAGAMNYGHNNPEIKASLIEYLENDNILHGLDMYTKAKAEFIETFVEKILKPRKLEYKLQFCGPTGTNAVEAALKLARKNTGRSNVIAFMGSFHGMSLGSLSVTSNVDDRAGAGLALHDVTFVPYPEGGKYNIDTMNYLKTLLSDDHSGCSLPAAIILETVQAEGGINVAPVKWLKELEKLCHEKDILLIVDDIQVGNSRCGTFFSFERAGIKPDMITLSKSISGAGLPMSLLLIREDLDIWKPGEHNGTWRGNQLAFVAAKEAILYNVNHNLNKEVIRKGKIVTDYIEKEILPISKKITYRGIGLVYAIDFSEFPTDTAKKISAKCFEKGLVIERCGRNSTSVKILPPLVIEDDLLLQGLEIIKKSIKEVIKNK